MQIYHVETQEDYDALMLELKEKGYDLSYVKSPTFFKMGKNCVFVFYNMPIQVASLEYAKNKFPETAIEKYKAKQNDVVNSPNHYTQGELEVIDILQDKLTPQEFEGFLKGNILKYTFRESIKNGTEDMEKGAWYMSRLIEFRKKQEGYRCQTK